MSTQEEDAARTGAPGRLPIGRERERVDVSLRRASEPGRGRDAKTPLAIPARGWLDVLSRVVEGYSRDRIGPNAAGAAFFLVFAIVPTLAALVSLLGLYGDPHLLRAELEDFAGYLPAGLVELMGAELDRLIAARPDRLSLAFATSLGIALWIVNSAVLGLFDALNVIYGEVEKRSWTQLYLRSFAFTIGSLVFALATLNAAVGIPVALSLLPLGPLGGILLAAAPTLVLFVVATLGIAALLRFGPSRAPARWRWITPGSLAAAAVWLLASAAFSYYVSNLADFTASYGSLGTVAAVLMWVWISMVILLVGAELDAELELQTARDTTHPPEAPLGARGAVVADHVGPARAERAAE